MEKKCPCYVEGKNTEKRMDMSKALFITGTGTDIGKTYVTGLIVKKLAEEGKSAAYYKAAMSGNDRRADGSLIPAACGWKPDSRRCPAGKNNVGNRAAA